MLPLPPSGSTVDLVRKERRRLIAGLLAVQEVSRQDSQRPTADGIARATLDARLLLRKVGDDAVVLLVLGVTKEHGASDLVLDSGVGLGKGVSHDSGALAI